jgi:REP element-mobilizing transposase RayT
MQRPRQLDLSIRTWGGRRPGSGRPPGPGRRAVPHRRRATHDPRCPVHVTLRTEVGVPSLRAEKPFAAIRCAFAAASRNGVRLLHFSVQSDHLHLVVEADAPTRLARGVQGLAIRVARAVNRVLRRRGRVWVGCYHARMLATPREVRNALVYVLQNWRKHVPGADGFDPRSSASAFAGWMTALPRTLTVEPVVAARTWLASVGWRRHGLLGLRELPRGAPGRR